MENYLTLCKQHLRNLQKLDVIHFVVGNESCDLDSAMSALVLAVITQTRLDAEKVQNAFTFPILNTTRSELAIKSEVLFWFTEALQLDSSLLICRDEIDFKSLRNKKVIISLVDHNDDEEFARIGQIVEIIDHHEPSFSMNNCPIDSTKLTIDVTVGSCCTLVAQRFLMSSLSSDTQIALMLYGPIILDTICFSQSAQRFNDKDIEIVEKLEFVLGIDESTRHEVYQQLIKARIDLSNLSVEQLLRKDLKILEFSDNIRIAVPSICGTLIQKLGFENKTKIEQIERFTTNNRFNAIVMLGIESTNIERISRDLAVFSVSDNLRHIICSSLESSDRQLELQLKVETQYLRIYNQGNVRASRKAILPLISSIFGDHNASNNSGQTSSQSDDNRDTPYGSSNSKFSDNNKRVELDMNSCDTKANPDSVYGSYFDDSFVGELVGDYANNKDDSDLSNTWPLNNGLNNEIEFEFDSFGPESIIYTGNNDIDDNNLNGNKISKELPEDILNRDSDNDESKSEKTITSTDSKSSHNINDATLSPNDSNHLSPEAAEENEFGEPLPFKRNTSLTQSQRRKISPRLSFQQILNASDDTTPTTPTNPINDVFSNEPVESNVDSNTDTNDSHMLSVNLNDSEAMSLQVEDDKSRGLTRRPSTTKKKIAVNRDIFSNEDIIDKSDARESSAQINELTAQEERDESRSWRPSCPIGPEGDVKPIDMKVIEPYKKVISHGGYFHSNACAQNSNFQSGASPAIIVFSTCYLPDRSRKDYDYVMDNLFMYVLTTLHNLVADDYLLIYFHNAGGADNSNTMPTFGWLKRCYYMIDRKLKKNLKGLYLVHPTFWLKMLIIMSKPFIRYQFIK